MRASDAPAQINVRLASASDLDKLEEHRKKAGARSVSEMIREQYGLTPWPDASPERSKRRKSLDRRASVR